MKVLNKLRPQGLRFNSLNSKLVVAFLALGLIPAALIGYYANQKLSSDIHDLAGARLAKGAVGAGETIDRNLFERYGDVQAFAHNPDAFGTAAEQQALVNFFTKAYGLYDLVMIVGIDGRVQAVNSVGGDGSSIDSSSLIGLDVSSQDWFDVVAGGDTPDGGTYYTDAYQSDLVDRVYGDRRLSLPFSAPILDASGEIVGVWHNEASFDRTVGDIFNGEVEYFASKGVEGVTAELLSSDGTLLIGPDPADSLKRNLVREGVEVAQQAIADDGSGDFAVEKLDGIDQVVGFANADGALGFDGYGWGVLVSQDESMALADATHARNAMLLIGAVIGLLVVAAGLVMGRSIARPLKVNAAKLKDVAGGNLTVAFDVDSNDEVGQTAEALNTALASISATLSEVDNSAAELTSASAGLTRLSDEMASNAKQTAGQATDVVAASEEISASSTAVAAAMEEMGASVREIAENTAEAARMTFSAVEASGLARARMEKLDASATDIGNVISVITSIAEQTNLLALNATIEAARVGEAGKGFAVVANEVKALAQQTATATEEIEAKIEAIQADAAGAVDAIAEISGLIDKVNEIATAIAGAVEEQSATTSEVSHSIHAVTEGTSNIAASITAVAEAADNTRDGASHAQQAAAELDQLASRLKQLLARFEVGKVQGRSSVAPLGHGPGTGSRPDLTTVGVGASPASVLALAPHLAPSDFDSLIPSGWD